MRSKRSPLGDDIYREASGAFSVKYLDPITRKKVGPKIVKDARNKSEAKRWRTEHVAALRARKAFHKDESVSTLADRWLGTRADALNDGNLKPRTYEMDSTRLVPTIKKHFGTTPVAAVTTEEVRGFLRALKSGKSALGGKPLARKTRANTLRALKMMFDMKIAEENGGFNPVNGLAAGETPSQQREREPIEMSLEQVGNFLSLAREWSPTYHPLFVLIANTGMRIEEALLIRWENVDLKTGWLTVTNGKQKAAADFVVVRLVPMSSAVKVTLAEARLASNWSGETDFVFAAGPGKHCSYRNVRRALRRISDLAGYGPTKDEHIKCHDFRHSLCMNVRASLRTDAEKQAFCRSLGWKDTTMFDRVYGQGRSAQEAMVEVAADVLQRAGVGV